MGFGAEMKDFVSGYKAGYGMLKSADEREDAKIDREYKRARTDYTRNMIGVQAEKLKLQQAKHMQAGSKKVSGGGNASVGLTGSAAFDRDFGGGGSTSSKDTSDDLAGGSDEDTLAFAEGGRVERQDRAALQDGETGYTDEKGYKYAIPESSSGAPMRMVGGPRGDSSRGYFPEVGEALDSGLRFLSKTFGLDKQGQAVGDDPNRQKAIMAWQAGAGGVEPEELAAAEKVVDPKGEMKPSQRRAAVIAEGYKYTKAKKPDDPEAPARYVASVLQRYKSDVINAGYDAELMLKEGNFEGAVQALKAAYDSVPDGNDIDIKAVDGGYTAQFIGPDSKPLSNPIPLTPQILQQQVAAAKSGLAFNQQVMSAAAARAKGVQAQRDPAATTPAQPPRQALPADEPTPQAPDVPAASPPAAEAPAPSPASTPSEGAALQGGEDSDVLAGGESSGGDPRPTPPRAPKPPNTQGLNAREARAYMARYKAEVEGPYNRARARYDADLRQWRADQNAMQRVALTESGANRRELARISQEERAAAREDAKRNEEADPNWKRNRQLQPAQREMMRASSQEQSTGGFYEPVAPDARRRSAEYQAADVGYQQSRENERFKSDAPFDDRVEKIKPVFETAMKEKKIDTESGMRLMTLADKVMQRNNTNDTAVAQMVLDMATQVGTDTPEPRVNPRTGEVSYKGLTVAMPRDVLMQLAAERGQRMQRWAQGESDKRVAENAPEAAKKQRAAMTSAMTGEKSPRRAAIDVEPDRTTYNRDRVAPPLPRADASGNVDRRTPFQRWWESTPSTSEARRNVGDALGMRGRNNGR